MCLATDAPCYTPRFNTPSRRDAIGRVGRLAEQDAWASCAKSRLERGGGEQKGAMALPLYPFFFNQGIALLKLRSRLSVDSRLKCSVPGNMDATVKHQATVEQREPRYDERKNTVITDISKQFENGRAGLVMHCSVKVKVKKTDKAKRRLALSGQQRLWRWRAPESVPGLDPCRRRANHEVHLCWKHNAPDTCCTLFTVFTVYTFPTRRLPSYRSSLLHLEHLSTSSTCNWH